MSAICIKLTAALCVLHAVQLRTSVPSIFKVTEQTRHYAHQMRTIQAFLLGITPSDTVLSKGILLGGGDTRFLILGDTISMYLNIPDVLAAFALDLRIWAVYLVLKLDMVSRFLICFARFRSKNRFAASLAVRRYGGHAVIKKPRTAYAVRGFFILRFFDGYPVGRIVSAAAGCGVR